MALPVNIEELIGGKTVEWERIEFRKGWNPERTLKTITAFANDFNNWGGGYIILGVEEKDGRPVLPPSGLDITRIDSIQKQLNNLCRKIIPNYFPIAEPVDFQGKKILILWCPGGSVRPYKCPESLGKGNGRHFYYIRRFSSTVKPTSEEEKELIGMSNQIPFDDRANHKYSLDEFDLVAIKTFLNRIGSELERDISHLSIEEISRKMNIAEGADENLLPKNVGLLFFAKDVQKIFPSSRIEIVIFKDNDGIEFEEKIFDGNLFEQTINALSFLENQVVKEKVIKREGKAEADRFFNYPYLALEEALCNAVYHRGYDNDSPIEVRIYPERIDIISFPGPLPPLDRERLKNYRFDVRKYRNRRIGEFLKELHLTEGRQTGIPTILKEIERNGSPEPVFETDEERSYFKTSFFIHHEFKEHGTGSGQAWDNLGTEHPSSTPQAGTMLAPSWHQVGTKLALSRGQVHKILNLCLTEVSIQYIMEQFEWKDRTKFRKKFIGPLLDAGLLEMTAPDRPTSPKQRYVITEKGKGLLKEIDTEEPGGGK